MMRQISELILLQVDATKRLSLTKLPEVLVLHVKRFAAQPQVLCECIEKCDKKSQTRIEKWSLRGSGSLFCRFFCTRFFLFCGSSLYRRPSLFTPHLPLLKSRFPSHTASHTLLTPRHTTLLITPRHTTLLIASHTASHTHRRATFSIRS
jgi:hypothetical protein